MITKVARKMHATMPVVRGHWTVDDLVQEIYLKALVSLESYSGRSSIRTWTVALARNHIVSLSRAAKRRPSLLGDASLTPSRSGEARQDLREGITDLLGWLRENPSEVDNGWKVLNLLLWTHGDHNYAALAMTFHTGDPWTPQRVRNTVRRIRITPRGRALCEALGITPSLED